MRILIAEDDVSSKALVIITLERSILDTPCFLSAFRIDASTL